MPLRSARPYAVKFDEEVAPYMVTVQVPDVQRLVLYGVSWEEYSRLLRAFARRRGVRVTFDRGVLEIMTLSLAHEKWGRFFNLLILAITMELGLSIQGGGSTTFRRRRRERGLEPDECYWIANEALVRDKDKIDLRRDPPPDLAVEVDISYKTINRMRVSAALRIPEVWRFDGNSIEFHVLDENGIYSVVAQSKSLPQVRSADLAALLPLRGTMDENALLRHFQAWARQYVGGGHTQP